MRSMTGFGRAVKSLEGREISLELRSVNHRYLDLAFRLPRGLQFLEPALRQQIGEALRRGHVDISLSYRNQSPQQARLSVDEPLARAYAKAARKLARACELKDRLKLSDLLQMPEVLRLAEPEEDEEALLLLARQAMAEALDELQRSREAEGEALVRDLRFHLDHLQALCDQMAALVPRQAESFRERLSARLQGLEMEGLEPQRLAQEVALFADRVAVDEELARLSAHIAQMRDILASGEAQGRKLDFLAQEMGRESNTIASKSSLLELTQLVLEAKTSVEKLREQIQNLE